MVKHASTLGSFRRILIAAVVTAAAVVVRSGGSTAQVPSAGALDPTFGTGGVVAGSGIGALAMVLQPDGKMVVAGESNRDFAVVRYMPDGNLDATFGTGGMVTTNLADQTASDDFDQANALALLPDGKLVAAGMARGGVGADFGLVRYLPDGTLDATFGVGGKVITNFDAFFEAVTALAVQPDGKLIAAGGAPFLVARYNPDGTPDATFGVGGKVTNSVTGGAGRAVVLQPDGKVVVGGWSPTTSDFILTRLHPDGSVDAAFGTGGSVETDFGGYAGLTALVLQTDGKLVAAGGAPPFSVGREGTAADFLLARYNGDGSLDASFGTNGKVTTDFFFASLDGANALTLQPDGKLIAAGFMYSSFGAVAQFAIARYNPDGSLDGTFGSSGKVTTHFGRPAFANALALQPDGRLVAAGSSGYPTGTFVGLCGPRVVCDPGGPAAYAAGGISLARYLSGAEACVVDSLALHPESQPAFVGGADVSDETGVTVVSESRRGSVTARLNPMVFRRLRDQVLVHSGAGRRYATLYARHSPEVVRLLMTDGVLRRRLLDGLLLWQGHAEALAEGRAVTITADQARAVDVVMDRLALVGSPRLRQAIDAERRAHVPGLTFAEAVLRAIGR